MATSEVVIEIRADNGPQFVAGLVRTYFRENGVSHVFTKPSTPQENGHIESFHGIMVSSMGNMFFRITEFDDRLEKFYKTCNHARAHTANKGLPPERFRKAWEADLVITCYDNRRPTMINENYISKPRNGPVIKGGGQDREMGKPLRWARLLGIRKT
ncbi:MAG: integrase core domain-containing protein [Flavobacteriales bacterium]